MDSEIVFNKDFEERSAFVMKTFDAQVSEVWDYFSVADLLDQWWAPEPWKCETLTMDFQENGKWHYAMVSPESEKVYGLVSFGSIMQHRSIEWMDDFADEKGNSQNSNLACNWLIGFTGVEEGTKLTVNIHFPSEDAMNKIFEMGFEEGFRMTLNQLENLLEKT